MHIVAVTSTLATAIEILFTLGVAEVSDRRVVRNNLASIVEASIDIFHGIFCILFGRKLDVGVSHDMLTEVVHHDHLLYLAEIAHFREYVFVELFEPKHLRLWGYLVMAFSASSLLTWFPVVSAVSTAVFSYMCSNIKV